MQNPPSKMENLIFPSSYQEARARFLGYVDLIQTRWPAASLHSHALTDAPDRSIDWLIAPALEQSQKLLVFSIGEHGIEGYVGAAVLGLFMAEIMPRLDSQTTGLLIIHPINPWGMAHRRRVNAQNIDLNRSFLTPDQSRSINESYARFSGLFAPDRPLNSPQSEMLAFLMRLAGAVLREGVPGLREAFLMGQYTHPRGIYYGGTSLPEETGVVAALFEANYAIYDQVVHLDMHTGYGPRYQMSLVNSSRETRSSSELSRRFNYPLVVNTTAEEFYQLQGDMIDYVYWLVQTHYPGKCFYATSFEFGTMGDSLLAIIRALRATIWENQLHWQGTSSVDMTDLVQSEYQALFFPQETDWAIKACSDARQALQGILRAEGYLLPP